MFVAAEKVASNLGSWQTWSRRWFCTPSAAARSSSVENIQGGGCSAWCWSSPWQEPQGRLWWCPGLWWCCPVQQTETQTQITNQQQQQQQLTISIMMMLVLVFVILALVMVLYEMLRNLYPLFNLYSTGTCSIFFLIYDDDDDDDYG